MPLVLGCDRHMAFAPGMRGQASKLTAISVSTVDVHAIPRLLEAKRDAVTPA